MIVSTDAQLAHANANAPEGELVKLAPKAFSVAPNPVRPGVTYECRGASFPSLTIRRDRTTVIGGVIRGTLTVEDCKRVTVRDCAVMADDLPTNRMLWRIVNVDDCEFLNVYSFGRITSASWDARGRCFYGMTNTIVQDCETVLEHVGPINGSQICQMLRDNSNDNIFAGDVVHAGLNSDPATARTLFLANAGNVGKTTDRNAFIGCDYRSAGLIYLQNIATDWRLTESRFRGSEVRTNRVTGLLVSGCMFQAPGAHAFIEDGARLSTGELRDCVFVSAADPGYGIGSAGLKVVNATSTRPPVDGG